MDGKEGKWKKEMEKRTLSTLLNNKENEDENASTKKLKTNSPQISNSAKTTFSQPFTTVALNTPTDSGSKNTNYPTPSISSLSSSSSSSASKVKLTDQLALHQSSPMSTASTSKPQSKQSENLSKIVITSYDYTNESDSLVKVLKLVGRIKNPNEFAVCGEASEMPGHAGIFIKDYGLITPPLPIYQAEEMVKKMRPHTIDVNSKSVGSEFEMKEIYELDACDIEFKNPKVLFFFNE